MGLGDSVWICGFVLWLLRCAILLGSFLFGCCLGRFGIARFAVLCVGLI